MGGATIMERGPVVRTFMNVEVKNNATCLSFTQSEWISFLAVIFQNLLSRGELNLNFWKICFRLRTGPNPRTADCGEVHTP